MSKPFILFCLLLLLVTPAFSQSAEEAAVTEVIRKLFTGMEKGDSATVHNVFAANVTLATALRDKANKPVLRQETSIRDFLNTIAKPRNEVLYEEIWNIKIQIDGDFAQVWCDYAFYITNTFSHCGVDAFHLHKGASGWKIFHLADTRRKEPCEIPADILKKHGAR